jgi:peptide/nickel transport system permease protein
MSAVKQQQGGGFLRPVVRVFRLLAARPLSLAGTLIVIVFALMALFGPMLAPHPYDKPVRDAEGDRVRLSAPTLQNPFGTDRTGYDVFSRVLYGAREIMVIPGIATGLSVALGAALGLALGYFGGWRDVVDRVQPAPV